MTVTNTSDNSFLVAVIYFVRVCSSHVFSGDFACCDDAVIASVAGNESVDDAVGNLLGVVGFDGVPRELTSGICSLLVHYIWQVMTMSLTRDFPKIKVQPPSFEIDSLDLHCVKLEVPVRIRRLDRVSTRSVAKHAITRHLDVEGMLLAVAEGLGQDPLVSLTTASQAVNRVSMLGPNQALVVRVPDELEVFLLQQVVGHGELDLEPVRRPAGAKRLADLGGLESMRGRIFEQGPREVRWRVDGQLDRKSVV